MSIINEALKKAGQPILTTVKESPKKKDVNWGPYFVVGILIVIAGPILTPLLKNPYQNETAGSREVVVGPDLSRPHMKKQFGVEEMALPSSAIAPRFTMSGLVYSEGTSYCLINGKVLTVGEAVGGARIIGISPAGAILEYRGQRITLPANA